MATYAELRDQIAALEKQASAIRMQERASKIAEARQLVKDYGLTASELGLSGSRRSPTSAGVPKFRDPVSGATWSGFGRKPQWLAGAKDPEVFRIGARPAPAATKKAASKKAVGAPKARKTARKSA